MIVMGIDPGSRQVGYGVLREEGGRVHLLDVGTLRTGRDVPLAQRLARVHQEIGRLLARHDPDRVAVESVFHGVNTRSLVVLGQARGAILAALGATGVELCELSPAEIKRAVTGRGRASKEQVAHMVWVLLGPSARQHAEAVTGGASADATDALAAALATLHRPARRALGADRSPGGGR